MLRHLTLERVERCACWCVGCTSQRGVRVAAQVPAGWRRAHGSAEGKLPALQDGVARGAAMPVRRWLQPARAWLLPLCLCLLDVSIVFGVIKEAIHLWQLPELSLLAARLQSQAVNTPRQHCSQSPRGAGGGNAGLDMRAQCTPSEGSNRLWRRHFWSASWGRHDQRRWHAAPCNSMGEPDHGPHLELGELL